MTYQTYGTSIRGQTELTMEKKIFFLLFFLLLSYIKSRGEFHGGTSGTELVESGTEPWFRSTTPRKLRQLVSNTACIPYIEQIHTYVAIQSLLITFTHFYSLLLTLMNRSLLLTFKNFYSLLHTFTHFYSLLLSTQNRYQLLRKSHLLTFTHFYFLRTCPLGM